MKHKSILYLLLALLVIGVGTYLVRRQNATPQDVEMGEEESTSEEDVPNETENPSQGDPADEYLPGEILASERQGWKLYRNTALGFEIEVPEHFEVTELVDEHNRSVGFLDKVNNRGLGIGLRESSVPFENYFYLDIPVAATTTVDGRPTRVFVAENGICEGPMAPASCRDPFVAYALEIETGVVLNIIFPGHQASALQGEILSTVKLIN